MDKYPPISLVELSEILPRLQATIELLTKTVPGQPRVARVPPRSAGRRPLTIRPADLRSQISAHLTKSGSASVSQIAKALRRNVEAVRYGLRVLQKGKVVRMTGEGRKTVWHAGQTEA